MKNIIVLMFVCIIFQMSFAESFSFKEALKLNPSDYTFEGKPTVADWDGDGLVDILFGERVPERQVVQRTDRLANAQVSFWKNSGTTTQPSFGNSGKIKVNGSELAIPVGWFKGFRNPQVVDLNGDGYQDLIVSDADLVCKKNPWPWTPGYGRVYYYKGGPGNTLSDAGFLKDSKGNIIDIGDCSIPIMTDWNGDGLFDLLLGTYGPKDSTNALSDEWRVYINTGNISTYEFKNYSTLRNQTGNPILASTLVIRDLDFDGKNDLIFSLNNGTRFGWYQNKGTKTNPVYDTFKELTVPAGLFSGSFNFYDLADINGDDVLDIIVVDTYYPRVCYGIAQSSSYIKYNSDVKRDMKIKNCGKQLELILPIGYKSADVKIYNSQGRVVYSKMEQSGILSWYPSFHGVFITRITVNGITQSGKFSYWIATQYIDNQKNTIYALLLEATM